MVMMVHGARFLHLFNIYNLHCNSIFGTSGSLGPCYVRHCTNREQDTVSALRSFLRDKIDKTDKGGRKSREVICLRSHRKNLQSSE